MKPIHFKNPKGFTLLETVIAIGVLAVLLSGFLVVFAPAAAGIRLSINTQAADRLASALETELAKIRPTEPGLPSGSSTSFDKAFDWIRRSNTSNGKLAGAEPIFVYQYRGEATGTLRPDGTRNPVIKIEGKFVGKDYVIVPMARRLSDTLFSDDLRAIEGAVYLVKAKQLVSGGGGVTFGRGGEIKNSEGVTVTNATSYPEAALAFAAEFHLMPSKDLGYFRGTGANAPFPLKFESRTPVFTRNIAVRR